MEHLQPSSLLKQLDNPSHFIENKQYKSLIQYHYPEDPLNQTATLQDSNNEHTTQTQNLIRSGDNWVACMNITGIRID
jgi:hypothetical protein